MRAYISVDTETRKLLGKEIIALGMAMGSANVEHFIFVDKYTMEAGQEAEFMQKAMKEIDTSNFIMVEATKINVTSCIELGYAKAKRKPIVYLQKAEAETNEVLFALSNFHILYSSPKDLFDQLSEFLKNVLPQN
ncbi:hypothetical protein NU10_03440 [Flavobacterium dauae]|uniref:hypothetical protein n=1 Tax=Flavobacterium dauae TaxID=1563479 RepID=UPI00101B2CA3|nr:hypothetical protein [Flavobacterium dauae]WLD24465.1 hypothetical protein NU10_03440 [Flavobacterium dauae]